MTIAFVLFFAFGLLCSTVLGQFGPREMGAFWPIYFMLIYCIAGFGSDMLLSRSVLASPC